MAKKFLNGYKQFSIERRTSERVLIKKYDFALKYQAMKEYSEEHWKQTTVKGGKIIQKFRYLYFFYTIDFSGKIEAVDSLKIQEIINGEIAGEKIILIPHVDAVVRYDEVIREKSNGVTDRMEFSLTPHAVYARGNTGLILNYRSANPWTGLNWIDSDTINTVSRRPLRVIR